MANAKKPPGKSPGGKGRGGNVVVDLGEEIDKLIAGKEKRSLGATSKHGGWRPPAFSGGFMGRPGFGFRPGIHRSQLGAALDMPAAVDPMKVLGGTLAGVAANRVLYRAIPYIAGNRITSELLVNGISAGVGILPYVVRKNAFTIGFAIPGVLTLANSLVDAILQAVRILPKPVLTGPSLGGSSPALASARQTIDAIRARMASRGTGYAPQPVRVQARPHAVPERVA